MKYVLGCNITKKANGEMVDGYCMIGSLGLYPSLYTKEEIEERIKDDKQMLTVVYDNLKDAQEDLSKLTKSFRRDDVWTSSSKWLKSKMIRNFYLLKVETPKYPFKLEKIDNKNKKTKLKGEIYELKLKE